MIEALTAGIRPTSAFRIRDGGETLSFYVCQTRTTKAAKQFLSKALNRSPHHRAYNEAIAFNLIRARHILLERVA